MGSYILTTHFFTIYVQFYSRLSGEIECEIHDSSEFTWYNESKKFKKPYTLKSGKTLVGIIANSRNSDALIGAYYGDGNIVVIGWVPINASSIGENNEFSVCILYK